MSLALLLIFLLLFCLGEEAADTGETTLILGADNGQEINPDTTSVKEEFKVAIYNGTETVGLTGEYEKKLSGIDGLKVISKTNAKKNDFDKTLVIDVSGKAQGLVNQLAQLVEGEVASEIPEGEAKPSADILIILGD